MRKRESLSRQEEEEFRQRIAEASKRKRIRNRFGAMEIGGATARLDAISVDAFCQALERRYESFRTRFFKKPSIEVLVNEDEILAQQRVRAEKLSQKMYKLYMQNPNPLTMLSYFQSGVYCDKLTLAAKSTKSKRVNELTKQDVVAEDFMLTSLMRGVQEANKEEKLTDAEFGAVAMHLLRRRDKITSLGDTCLASLSRGSPLLEQQSELKLRQKLRAAELQRVLNTKTVLRIADMKGGKKYLILDGPQPLQDSQAIVQAVRNSPEPVGGTYIHLVQWPKGFITQDRGCTGNIKNRTVSRRFETVKEGAQICQTILTFSLGPDAMRDSFEALELQAMKEVLYFKTIMGYREIPFASINGLIKVPIATTLNLNDLNSPVPFPEKYKKVLLEKSYTSWLYLNDHPSAIWDIQKGKLSVEEFKNIGEPSKN